MGSGQPGNRQDNRQRGNAAQLLEKYKNMARDSQLAGDRVQTEYYLQFADHYFRVLGESRSRFEDQRRGRDDEMDEDDGDEDFVEAGEELVAEERPQQQQQRQDRGERFPRRERPRREDREERGGREGAEAEPRHVNGGGETIPFDVLPPAIARDENDSSDEVAEEQPRPRRRRTRAARPADGEGEIAPAA
jgi:Domain of unknown function (DUF4167)